VRRIVRPLVVIGPSPEDPTLALIVGVTGKPNTDNEGGGNFFTHSFKMAAERVHARFKHDSFEASVVQVAERDLGSFMEALSDLDAERLARSMANEAN
jgi:cell division control protein 45